MNYDNLIGKIVSGYATSKTGFCCRQGARTKTIVHGVLKRVDDRGEALIILLKPAIFLCCNLEIDVGGAWWVGLETIRFDVKSTVFPLSCEKCSLPKFLLDGSTLCSRCENTHPL